MIKSTPAYTISDKFIHYDEKFEMAKEGAMKTYAFVNDKVYGPLKENFLILYDQSTHYIAVLINIIKEHQQKVIQHISKYYENITVAIQDNWLRLDFNNDGHVSMEDIRTSVKELYAFLRDYHYLEKAVEIKSALYEQAIKYMQKEVEG